MRLSPTRPNRSSRRFQTLRLEPLELRWLPAPLRLSLAFDPNVGQAGAAIDFVAEGEGVALAISAGILAIQPAHNPGPITLSLVGGNPRVAGEAEQPLQGRSNYLEGSDPGRWHTGIPSFGRVTYRDVYAGIDLAYHDSAGNLEYDFTVEPGAVAANIRLGVNGAASWRLDEGGGLVLHTDHADVEEQAPVAYQDVHGIRYFVPVRYVLQDGFDLGFAVGAYDQTQPLVIDPVLLTSSYLGGSGSDYGRSIAVDGSGNLYLAGFTSSANFPTTNALRGTFAGGADDAFIAKLNPAGTALLYATYLGGSGDDQAYGVAVDASGNAYVTGTTSSSDFPTVTPFQAGLAGAANAFVAKLNPAGTSLVWSTYLGGSGNDLGHAIAVDSAGGAWVTGDTSSTNFPTLAAAQPAYGGGSDDSFITHLGAAGNQLLTSTYVGGSGGDFGRGIGLDSAGNAYVAGHTDSSNFPTKSALQPTNGGVSDGFVTKVQAGGTLGYSTYLGGTGADFGEGIAVDPSGGVAVTGFTFATDFPTVHPLQAALAGGSDAFLSKINAAGNAVTFSTYLGGGGDEEPAGMALDSAGEIFLTGKTGSSDFPTVSAIQSTYGGGMFDGFVAKLNATNSAWSYSTFLGGEGTDLPFGIAVDTAANADIAGYTSSTHFPTASPIQGANAGGSYDAFMTRIASHFWQGADVAVRTDGRTDLLWGTLDGRSDLWSITGATSAAPGPVAGPLAGWTVKAVADGGGDGLARILWTSAAGPASLWLVNADGSLHGTAVFSVSGWQAQDVAADAAGASRILWFNPATGKMRVWTVSDSFAVTSGPAYGPFSGWTAARLAAGTDGRLRVLWTSTNGAASVWLLDSSNTKVSSAAYAPIAGWTAIDVTDSGSQGTDLLWSSSSASSAGVWALDASLGVASTKVYGGATLAGWQVQASAYGGDGLMRLLWTLTDGTTAVWLLNANGTFNSAGVFGPF